MVCLLLYRRIKGIPTAGFSKYANPKKQELEKGAYEKAMVEKHEEAD